MKSSRWGRWLVPSLVALVVLAAVWAWARGQQPWKRWQAAQQADERAAVQAALTAHQEAVDATRLQELEAAISDERARLAAAADPEGEACDEALPAFRARRRAAAARRDAARQNLVASRTQSGLPTDAVALSLGAEADAPVDLHIAYREARKTFEGYEEMVVSCEARRQALDALEAERQALFADVEALAQRAAALDKSAPRLRAVQPAGLERRLGGVWVPRVDRCVTCHLDTGHPDTDQPSGHPRPDLFVGASSPHPVARFGCTVCHGGMGRATDFTRAGHLPRDDEQAAAWRAQWGWQPSALPRQPILAGALVEASCQSCHGEAVWTLEAPQQLRGQRLMQSMGCHGCHTIDQPAFRDRPRVGPSLARIASKTTPGWAYRWIAAPRDIRPTTWMPHLFTATDEATAARQAVEIRAIVAYLWRDAEGLDDASLRAGDAASGRLAFETLGCRGCHLLDGSARRDEGQPIARLHGPNLIGMGDKVNAVWLRAWLRNPAAHQADTPMPDLRLSAAQAADLAAFLMGEADPAREPPTLPPTVPTLRDDLVRAHLERDLGIEASQARLEAMSEVEREHYLGAASIAAYGCHGCHEIPGFEEAAPAAGDLSHIGDALQVPGLAYDLTRGHVAWRDLLAIPRQTPQTAPRPQPDYGMSAAESTAVLINLLGFRDGAGIGPAHRPAVDGPLLDLAAGRRLVDRFNCQACHALEGGGPALAALPEAAAGLPPALDKEGARVQGGWLFRYLHDPGGETLRPWLTVRMPTFTMTDDERDVLVRYFAARAAQPIYLASPPPAAARERAVGAVVFSLLQCARCHPPASAAGEGLAGADTPREQGPDLRQARHRLRPAFVVDWLLDPAAWAHDTAMPVVFPRGEDGTHDASYLLDVLAAPMFSAEYGRLRRHFESAEAMAAYLSDAPAVAAALRDYVWTLGE